MLAWWRCWCRLAVRWLVGSISLLTPFYPCCIRWVICLVIVIIVIRYAGLGSSRPRGLPHVGLGILLGRWCHRAIGVGHIDIRAEGATRHRWMGWLRWLCCRLTGLQQAWYTAWRRRRSREGWLRRRRDWLIGWLGIIITHNYYAYFSTSRAVASLPRAYFRLNYPMPTPYWSLQWTLVCRVLQPPSQPVHQLVATR